MSEMQQKREMARSLQSILQVGKTPACNRWKNKMRKEPHPGLMRTEGHIGLCGHRDAVEFKSIEVSPLPLR
jgi:hypothetical protein